MAADRYHHYQHVIAPALAAGQVVACDRYVTTALVLEQMDGADPEFVWSIYRYLSWISCLPCAAGRDLLFRRLRVWGFDEPERRSGGVSLYPLVTVNHLVSPSDRARGGHDFLIGDCNRGHQGRVYRLAEEVGALQQSSEGRLSVVDEVLRAQARHRRLRRPGLAAAMLLLAVVASLRVGPSSHPSEARAVTIPRVATVTRTGAVTGYIQPCDGLGVPLHTSTGARLFSAAATIEALRGHEYLKPVGHGTYRVVFPAVVAARESVAQNQQFRIDHLAPGRYVIWARYAGGNVSTSLDVSVAAGKVADIDLPNVCM